MRIILSVVLHLKTPIEHFGKLVLSSVMALNGRVKEGRRLQLATALYYHKAISNYFIRAAYTELSRK